MNNTLRIQLIEGILFLKGKIGINVSELKSIVKISEEELAQIFEDINNKYVRVNSPFVVKVNGDKVRISLNKETSEIISKKLNKPLKIKLTKASIEVLTIISYYQPITRTQINKIRKSSSDYILQKLSILELVEAKEKAHSPGNPRLWTTTDAFLEAFDLETIEDLPNYQAKIDTEDDLFKDILEEKKDV